MPPGLFPLLFAALNVIYITSAKPRWKRSEESDTPLVLQLPADIFRGSGLQDVYSGLPEEKQDYLQVREPEKRDAHDNDASFVLRINPFIPRNPVYLRNFTNLNCVKQNQWCIEQMTRPPPICPPNDTPTPEPTTCGPSKPAKSITRFTICNYERSDMPPAKDPCDECTTTIRTTTKYVACFSVPPPTRVQRLKYCNPTLIACHNIPCTYKMAELPPSPSPPTPPPCDASLAPGGGGQEELLRNPQAGLAAPRYYILVKRSPGAWARRKRDSPVRRRYRIFRDPPSPGRTI